MASTLKKFIKYVVVLGLLGGIVFVGLKIIFPQPDNMDAYNKTFALIQNEDYEFVSSNIEQMRSLMEENLPTVNSTTYYKLSLTVKTLSTLEKSYAYMLSEIAFAKNNTVYDDNAKKINSKYEEITSDLAKAKTYIQNTVIPFYESSIIDSSAINIYSLALLNYNSALTAKVADFNIYLSEIFYNLMPTSKNNPLSTKIIEIVNIWANNQIEFLNSDQELSYEQIVTNTQAMLTYATANLTTTVTDTYLTNKANADALLLSIEKADIKQTTKNVGLVDEEGYVLAIEDEEIRNATSALFSYLKGV